MDGLAEYFVPTDSAKVMTIHVGDAERQRFNLDMRMCIQEYRCRHFVSVLKASKMVFTR